MIINPTQTSMDALARALMKDQKAFENYLHSFLNPNSN